MYIYQLTLRANFVQPLQFHHLLSVTFHFGYCLRQSKLPSANVFVRAKSKFRPACKFHEISARICPRIKDPEFYLRAGLQGAS